MKKLTPKDLGLVDGVKLSDTYRNTRERYKVVEPTILGYYVAAGMNSQTRIAPIYRATVYEVSKKTIHCIESHELGNYLNPRREADEEADVAGDGLAYLAMTTLGLLEKHARTEMLRRDKKRQVGTARPPRPR
jgi:hypothetical protein